MISRRLFSTALGIGAVSFPAVLRAQTPDILEEEISSWANDSSLNKGSLILPPSHEAVIEANEFLSRAPRGGRPIDIVRWFAVNTPPGKLEWPADTKKQKNPANPVIVAFFGATKLAVPPKGDQTAWCAAFACWVLQRAGMSYPKSAASADFRKWAQQTDDPEQGDIVVFKNKSDPSFGHVGFFNKFNSNGQVEVFGGNQSDKINKTAFDTDGSTLIVHSYRTAPGYR